MLSPITEEELLTRINTSDTFVHQMTEQLRIIRSVDEKQYSVVKKKLPYVVCGHFNPAIRRTENFAYIENFILDIDHLSSKGLVLENVKLLLRKDERVVMCYVSPSQDGLKVLFHLSDKCYDSGIFSVFYKAFSRRFSQQYGLEQVIDTKTSDVTRACFICYDKEAYFNPLATDVVISDYIDVNNPVALFDEKQNVEKKEKMAEKGGTDTHAIDPNDDVISRIKEILALKKAQQVAPQVYVPAQVNEIMDQLKEYLQAMDVRVDDVLDISYGKKIRCSVGSRRSETNIFYGKKGYSVVVSPKSGTNQELNEMVADLLKLFLDIA